MREGVEVMDKLNLTDLKNSNYFVKESNATSGEGIDEGLGFPHNYPKNDNEKK